jgi:hypothetical protein
MPSIDLTAADWSAIWDALDYASEDVGYDLYDTRHGDFYDAEERKAREDKQANWDRLANLLAPLAKETTNAND